MDTNYTHFPTHFVSYETNRITCDYPNEEVFLNAMDVFEKEGFDTNGFYILHGESGIQALDPDGHEHGVFSVLLRKIHAIVSEAEEHSLEGLVEDLKEGMIHVGVPAAKQEVRDHAHSIMDRTGGGQVIFFGRFYVETFKSAS
jgi:hypothetical protein